MKKKYVIPAILTVALTAIDQAVKVAVIKTMALYTSEPIIAGFFNLVHIRNRGAAWGFLGDDHITWQIPLFILVTVIALAFIVHMLRQTRDNDVFMYTGLGMIAGGAIGNLIDRVRLGEVVDFLDFQLGSYHWPAFNVADMALTIGAFSVLVSLYLNRGKEDESGSA